MPQVAHVSTPSRLHFGLSRFEHAGGGSFGGLGMMIDQPRLRLEIVPALQWKATGPSADRALKLAQHAMTVFQPDGDQALQVEVQSAPPQHVGLGAGTQLALAVATAVRATCDLPPIGLSELASAMGRGQRSSVGAHGFCRGGLILEAGHFPGNPLGQILQRADIPGDWQILLITPRAERGYHGKREADLFDRLAPIPPETTQHLEYLAAEEILPAARNGDACRFDQSLYQYGLLAGNCFATVQGGPFASAEIARRVGTLRRMGIGGVGQSSWGPMIFAMVRNLATDRLIGELHSRPEFEGCDFAVAAPDNAGAVVTCGGRRAQAG